jgi:hypothetical protein
MISNSQTIRLLGVVVRSLRKEFPDDFYKRCYYAAFAMRALLQDAGVEAEIVGGDFVAFIICSNGARAGMQGFGFGEGQCSHFWVVAEGLLLDVGPHLLPNDSSYPVAAMPFVAWAMEAPFPAYLRYRPLQRFPAEAVMSVVPEQNARCDRFIADCRTRLSSQIAGSKPLSWLLTGPGATEAAARGRDPWAQGALRFTSMTPVAELPF